MIRHLSLTSIRAWRRRSLWRAPAIVATAPYPIDVYRTTLRRLLGRRGVTVFPFTSRAAIPRGQTVLFVRHDVDTRDCVRNMGRLLAVDHELGIPAATYIRVDGIDYDPAECREEVARQKALGMEVGLHSSCYLEDDFFGAFRRELDVFQGLFGFAPVSFTMHGLGAVRTAERTAFTEAVPGRLDEFGIAFSDCNVRLRTYRHVVQDCNLDQRAPGRRCMYVDFAKPEVFLEPGHALLLLTHPCYWQ
ncbi:hypothetical protein [Azospirillum sp. sgz302134]